MAEHLVRARDETDPEHGFRPSERPPELYVRYGSIVLDKPKGPTSHQVAAWVRDVFGLDRAGHGGTLDPNVTGLLPIGLAEGTKALSQVKDTDKAYVGVMLLHGDVDREDLEGAFERFTGEIQQTPPKRSAVKREMRTRRVDALDILEVDERRVLFSIDCEGGTYVRKIATDVGTFLGVGAHLQELRRTRVGHLEEAELVNLHTVQDAWDEWTEEGRDDWLREAVQPMEHLLEPLARLVIRDSAVDALCRGAPLGLPGLLEVDRDVRPGQTVVIETLKGEAVALAEAEMPALQMVMQDGGVAARPKRALMDPGTYPKGW